MTAVGLALGAAVGLALGLLGGGGSILTVPIFVYVLGLPAKEAIAASLAVVGVVSLLGVAGHWRAGNVNVRVALLFGAVAMAGSYVGARLSVLVSGGAQLTLFAVVMLAAAVLMFRRQRPATDGVPSSSPSRAGGSFRGAGGSFRGAGGLPGGGPGAASAGGVEGGRLRVPLVVVEGAAVGMLSGMVGVGGGFLIVPALVVVGGLAMKEAVGTSLLVIVMNSAAGFSGYLGRVEVPWEVLSAFTAVAAVGILLGSRLVRHVSSGALRRGFATFLVVMAVLILYQNRGLLLPGVAPAAAETAGTAGPERPPR